MPGPTTSRTSVRTPPPVPAPARLFPARSAKRTNRARRLLWISTPTPRRPQRLWPGQTWPARPPSHRTPGNAPVHRRFWLWGDLAGQWISATATDEPNASLGTPGGNTSEFSLDGPGEQRARARFFTQNLPAALPQSTTGPNTLTIQANTTSISDVVTAVSPSNLGTSVVPVSVYLNLAPGNYTATTVQVPTGMTLYINGTPGT